MTVATNPLTYNDYVTQIGVLAVVKTTTTGGIVVGVDAPLNSLIPQMLNYAELRIQRDADLLPLQTSNAYTFTPGNNTLTVPVDDFVTVQDVSVSVGGTYTPLLPVSKEFIQYVYPSNSTQGLPAYFSMLGGDRATAGSTSNLITVGPPPDSAYPASIVGTIRMPSLYKFSADPTEAAASTTFISTYLPDLLLMASMIYISAFQRNFGRLSDDPAMAMTYETQYAALLKGALVEEARKRFSAAAWSSMGPAPIATASR